MKRKTGRSGQKEVFRSLSGRQKVRYIWDYYKLQLILLGIGVYVAGFILHSRLTHKDTVLYAALVNVTAGDTLTGQLGDGFLDSQKIDRSKKQLELYTGLYLTGDTSSAYHEYTYASRMKILASINAEELDVVLMDQEAFDAFAEQGFLADLDALLPQKAPALYEWVQPYLVSNTVILSDNATEVQLDPSVAYVAETDEYPMAVDLSGSGLISQAGFDGTVYLGIIGNTPRMDAAVQYLDYLTKD